MTAFGAVPSWLCALIMPVGFAVICVRYLLHTVRPDALEPPDLPDSRSAPRSPN